MAQADLGHRPHGIQGAKSLTPYIRGEGRKSEGDSCSYSWRTSCLDSTIGLD